MWYVKAAWGQFGNGPKNVVCYIWWRLWNRPKNKVCYIWRRFGNRPRNVLCYTCIWLRFVYRPRNVVSYTNVSGGGLGTAQEMWYAISGGDVGIFIFISRENFMLS